MHDSAVKAHMMRHMLRALTLNAAVRRSVSYGHLSPKAWVDLVVNDMHAIVAWHQHMWAQALLLRREQARLYRERR